MNYDPHVASVHFECFMLLVCVSVKPLYPVLALRPADRNTYEKQGDAFKSVYKDTEMNREKSTTNQPLHNIDNRFLFFVLTAISAQTNEAASPSQDLSGIFKHKKRFCFHFAPF